MKKNIPFLAIIASSFLSVLSFGQSGKPDPTFGTGGKVVTNFSAAIPLYLAAEAVIVQPDGKIVTVGKISGTQLNGPSAVFRYNPDGSPDTSFDHDGLAIIGIGPVFNARSVAIQDDGKLVVVGSVNYPFGNPNFALARYNTDGSLDNSFDNDGKLIITTAQYDEARSVAIQADGKIVVVGYTIPEFIPGVSRAFEVVRFNTDGSPDGSFDGDGRVTTAVGGSSMANSVAIQADDKIVVAGQSDNRVLITRYNADGSLDNSFDGDGIVTTLNGINSFANSVAIQTDGRIVIAGSSDFGSQVNFIATRYNTDGSPDNSFNTDGTVTTTIGINSFANSIALQADGKIILAGTSITGNITTIAMTRYDVDGSLDNNFNNDGILTTEIGSSSAGNSVAVQADGKILLAGFSTLGTGLAMSRYNTNGTLDNGFDGDGILTTDFGYSYERANAISIQSDGKIVTAGINYTAPSPAYNFNPETFIALARYNTDGSLDNSFDGDGKLTSPSSTLFDNDNAEAVTLQTDGKILVAGSSFASGAHDFAVARYHTDGSPDNSFDNDGQLNVTFGYASFAQAIALQTDGKILAGGHSSVNAENVSALARYNTDGSLDKSFDGDGKLSAVFGIPSSINSIVVQGDGRILVAGAGPEGFAIARLNSDGSFDGSFDGDGKLNILFSSPFDAATAMTIQADGRILIAGDIYNGSLFDFALARVNTDGSLDNSFDEDGKLTFEVRSPFRLKTSLGIQTDGRIVSSFNIYSNLTSLLEQAVLVRYNPDGSLDHSFGSDGKVVTNDLPGTSEYIAALKISGNRIYVAGYSHTEKTQNDFFVAAYLVKSTIQLSCPSEKTAQVEPGQCQAMVNDIDPLITPQGNNSIISYELSGATITNGTGSVSGQYFNKGVTTVTYFIAGEPEKTCSFTVTVNAGDEICNNGIDDDCDGRVDEDCRKLPKIYIKNIAVREGNHGTRNAVFEISVNKRSDKPITVHYQTADRSARAPGDYEEKEGVVTFPPNVRTKRIVININGDRLPEPNEKFSVILSDAVNGVIRDGRATGTIIDDDPQPAMKIHDAVAVENCQQVLVRVSLNESSEQVITVRYYTKNGSAKSPEDFRAINNGTLVFQPGEIGKNISIVVQKDAIVEPTEKFYVVLRHAENAVLKCSEAKVRLEDSDPGNRLMSKGATAEQTTTDEHGMLVAPNPANDAIKLRLLNKAISGKIQVELIDQNGRIVKQWIRSFDAEVQSINLPVADIPGGVYLIVLKNSKGKRFQQQVVVQH